MGIRKAPEEIRSVLVFCLPGIGDSLLMTPALRALRKALPGARLSALTMFSAAADVLRQCSYLDEVIHFDLLEEGFFRSLAFVLGLRRRRFDVSILGYPANRLEYNLLGLLVGARVRIGHRYNHLDFACGNWLNTLSFRENDGLSNIEENLRLVEALTGMSSDDLRPDFALAESHREYAREWIGTRGLNDEILIGFHAGGSTRKNHDNKRWPAHHFADLGKRLSRELGARILVFGGPEEDGQKEDLACRIGGSALTVSTPTILETCALMECCSHFVSNDNALLHLAGVLGLPTTAIFGPTNPRWVRIPEARREEVTLALDCQPCFYYSPRHLHCSSGDFHCLRDLSAATVAGKVLAAVKAPRACSARASAGG